MKTAKNGQETQEDLPVKIAAWLSGQGYPLEMETATAFKHQGFQTSQSEFYPDTETGQLRETDVVASSFVNVAGVLIRLTLVVECKLSKDKPWLLFSTGQDELPKATSVLQRASSKAGAAALEALMHDEGIQNAPLFQMTEETGYSITQAFATGEDKCFKAIMNVSKATSSMALHSDGYNVEKNRVEKVKPHYAHLLFPVLVLDGRLFRCVLNVETEKIEVVELSNGILVWRNPVLGQPHTVIHIVTRNAIQTFAEGAAETFQKVRDACEGSAKNRLARIPDLFKKARRRTVTHVNV